MTKEIETLIDQSPIGKSEAQKIAADFAGFAEKVTEWELQANAIEISSVDDKESMQAARTLRLELRDARIDAEKTHKSWKQDVLDRGRLIDACKNLAVGLIKPIEQSLKEKEDYAIKVEEARIQAIALDRLNLLAPYSEDQTPILNLGTMPDTDFDDLLAGRKARFLQAEAERVAAEKLRLEQEEAERLERERIAKENEQLKKEAAIREQERLAAEKAKEAEIAKLKLEQERLAEQAEKAKQAEIAKIRAEEEKKRLETEVKAKQEKLEQERLAEVEKEERLMSAQSNQEKNLTALEKALAKELGEIKDVMKIINRYMVGRDDNSWETK